MLGNRGFIDAPASRHDNQFNLAFADGHAEGWKLTDPRTIKWTALPIPNSPENRDWMKLNRSTSSLRQ
jgi:prepilin-type processing-associated H-X9-DG protein